MGHSSSNTLNSLDTTHIADYAFSVQNYPQYMNARKYRLQINQNQDVKYKDYLQICTTDSMALLTNDIIDMMTEHMNSFPCNDGYFFETPPITYKTYESIPFEFVLIPSDQLASVGPDFSPFHKKFARSCQSISSDYSKNHDQNESVISFANINGDSTLVVPCPVNIESTSISTSTTKDFAHISKFLRNADKKLIREAFKRLALEIKRVITEHPDDKFWVSTSGLGVSWVHFRIDSRPKYYNWDEYKNA